ncbi:hypothetical protein ACFX1X_027970 [Malus domestica]|uniref:Uncharacterized protein n=1 Tax=Malus domestica TaxID=3750 RepID=A0A498KHK9_MALDO|nr:hypothetical protein DVH24_026022 [Malus domestica]
MPTWKGQKISIAHVSFLATVPTWKGQMISIKVNECPCPLPSPPLSSPPPTSPTHVPPSSPPLISTHLPSPSNPNRSQPPYVQVTSPSPSPVDNGYPKGPSNSVALMHKGLFGVGFGVLLLVFGASKGRSTLT